MSIDYNSMAFPKKSWKEPKGPKWQQRQKKPEKISGKSLQKRKRSKRRNIQKVPSIMQDKNDRRCYLCMLLENDYRNHTYLEEHHVLFGAFKWVADAFGLRVNLCRRHHRESEVAVHNNQVLAEMLKRIAQEKFEEAYPHLRWQDYVEKNYLEVEDDRSSNLL